LFEKVNRESRTVSRRGFGKPWVTSIGLAKTLRRYIICPTLIHFAALLVDHN